MLLRASLPFVACILLFAGCLTSRDSTYDPPRTTVEVVNNNFYDVNMFIVRANQRIRLGFVQSNTTEVLDIPSYIASAGGMVFFVADPVGGGRSPFAEERFVEQGQQIRIVIPGV